MGLFRCEWADKCDTAFCYGKKPHPYNRRICKKCKCYKNETIMTRCVPVRGKAPKKLLETPEEFKTVYQMKLAKHVRLCRKNLRNPRTQCCTFCPFEEMIVSEYPEFKKLFDAKRGWGPNGKPIQGKK